MFDKFFIIELLAHIIILYIGLSKFNGEHIHIFSFIIMFNLFFKIGVKMFTNNAIKKEMIMNVFVKSCIMLVCQIMMMTFAHQYEYKNFYAVAIIANIPTSLIIYFLNKNNILSHN